LAEGELVKKEALLSLCEDWDLPMGRIEWTGRGKDKIEEWVEFDSPLASLEGRKWLAMVWDAFGVVNPPITDKGRLATKAETLRELIENNLLHPDLVEILNLVMTVTTVRTVYQTVESCLVGDRVYPTINMGQASGRSSVTNPGLTVFGKRGERFHERDIFIPEDDDWCIFSCDLKQVDMRAIAGLSQDPNYMALFDDGRDPHTEVAIQIFGDAKYRQQTKPITHGSNYGLGANKLIAQGHDPDLVRKYFAENKRRFPVMFSWRDKIRAEAKSSGYLDNGFGRKMKCDPYRVYTQAPALMGQGAAADILKECILRLPDEFRPYVRLTVHDEIDFACLKKDYDEISREVLKAMTFEWRGIPIEADLSEPADSWGASCEH
jgi:DNA polymerase-1